MTLTAAALCVAMVLCWSLLTPGGISVDQWQGWVLAAAPLAIASMSQTLPIIAGGQGLSAGATMVLVASVVAGMPMATTGAALMAIALGLAVGVAVGCINGFLIGFLGLRSTPVTLATGGAAMAFALDLIGGYVGAADSLSALVYGWTLGGVPLLPLLLLALVCIAGMTFQRTRLGLALRAQGSDIAGARGGGTPVFIAYTAAGAGAALGGILLAAAYGLDNLSYGAPLLPQILAAIALGGGVSGLGGGSVLGSLLGALVVVTSSNLLMPLGISEGLLTAVDAGWLLLGLLLCVARRPTLPPAIVTRSAHQPLRWTIVVGCAFILLLAANLRPEAADLAAMAAGVGVLAVGQMAILRNGTVDLSMPALISMAAVTTVTLTQGVNDVLPKTLLLILAVALAVGLFHGWIATRIGRAVMIATLATAGILQAVSVEMLLTQPTGFTPRALTTVNEARWLGMSPFAWGLAVIGLVMVLVLDWPSSRRRLLVTYVASALASALFGIFVAAYGGSAGFSPIDTYLLPAVAAGWIAHTLSSGRGSVALAIPAAIALFAVDTVLLGSGAGYSMRIGALAVALVLAEWLGVPQSRCSRPTAARPGYA